MKESHCQALLHHFIPCHIPSSCDWSAVRACEHHFDWGQHIEHALWCHPRDCHLFGWAPSSDIHRTHHLDAPTYSSLSSSSSCEMILWMPITNTPMPNTAAPHQLPLSRIVIFLCLPEYCIIEYSVHEIGLAKRHFT